MTETLGIAGLATAGTGLGLAGMIVLIVQQIKKAGLPSNLCGLFALGLGLLGGVMLHFTPDYPSWPLALFAGLGAGGIAAGSFDAVKGAIQAIRPTPVAPTT